MSTLTHLVEKNATIFREAVVNPFSRSPAKLIIEPGASYNATLVGHAFDLWLRCFLASHGIINVDSAKNQGYSVADVQANRAAIILRQAIAKDAMKNPDVLHACLTLAAMEAQSRSGRLVDMTADMHATINELKRLIERVNTDWMLRAKSGINNPQFGVIQSGKRSIKADGDLLLGRNLIELKTGRTRKKQMEGWRQLAGYVVLNSMRLKPIAINRVTLWFVRFGEPMTVPVSTIFKPRGREILRSFFEEYLMKVQTFRRPGLLICRRCDRSASKTGREIALRPVVRKNLLLIFPTLFAMCESPCNYLLFGVFPRPLPDLLPVVLG